MIFQSLLNWPEFRDCNRLSFDCFLRFSFSFGWSFHFR